MGSMAPTSMRALVLERHDHDLERAIQGLRVATRPVPAPRSGEVLVRIEAAPCNLSDLLFLQGRYGVRKTLPTVPGWEGAGTVVAAGGGPLARWLVGRRVACGGQADVDGTWAEYAVAEARRCVPLGQRLTTEQGATLIINPLTALGLFDRIRRGGHRAAVQTGAASQLGRMLLRMALDAGLPMIHVVRRAEQVELLRSLGASHVLDASAEGFATALRGACAELGATIALDAVAGPMTGALLDAMPDGGTVVVYGALSLADCSAIDPIGLIFRNARVEGFYLGEWLRERGRLGAWRAVRRVTRRIADGSIDTVVRRRAGLDAAVEGLLGYAGRMTEGKLLICPHLGA